MYLYVLGGGHEVGASCLVVEAAGKRVLVDAGIRMNARGGSGTPGDPLPDLAYLSEIGGIDAIIVTHAHMDHTGALPLVHQAFPQVPVYTTPATARLMQVLLADALRVMSSRAEQELEVPLYDAALVNSLLVQVQSVDYSTPCPIADDSIKLSFYPAGHILGAALVFLETREGCLALTGDCSVTAQRTVPGLVLPRMRPDALVTESTYGNRLHANREVEERRLATTVAEVIERGGKVLIPAFALGRAQEVILVIQQYQRDGLIADCPVWVDGLVRNICEVYTEFADYLQPFLRRRVERGESVFFTKRGHVRAVQNSAQREQIVEGEPCVIISSSGMLSGGPSQTYALELAGEERNAILLTGYQDEESPGRRLLDLAERGGVISMGDRFTEVCCTVGKFGLSAHADAAELTGLTQRLAPRQVVLVHGDADARQNLASQLLAAEVYLPDNGERLVLVDKVQLSNKPSAQRHVGIGRGHELTAHCLRALWEHLAARNQSNGFFSPAELAEVWYGETASPEQVATLRQILQDNVLYFTPDRKRPFLYRPRLAAQVDAQRIQQVLMEHLRDRLPGSLVLLTHQEQAVPGVCFTAGDNAFQAWVVGESDTDFTPDQLVEILGTWSLPTNPDPGTEKTRLHLFTRTALPMHRRFDPAHTWRLLKEAGSLLSLSEILSGLEADPQDLPSRLGLAYLLASLPQSFLRSISERGDSLYSAGSAPAGAGLQSEQAEPVARMEMNTALAMVDEILPADSGLYRKGADIQAGRLLLYFNFPEAVMWQWSRQLQELSELTGWEVELNRQAHQGALVDLAYGLLPAGWRVVKAPSVRIDRREVTARCAIPGGVTPEAVEQAVVIGQTFSDKTGWQLAIEVEKGKPLRKTPFQPPELEALQSEIPNGPPLEINLAYSVIQHHFDELGVTIYKKGRKSDPLAGQDFLEVTFITPQVGVRYTEELILVSQRINWPIRLGQQPNQNAIQQLVRSVLQLEWALQGEASLFAVETRVVVKLSAPPPTTDPEWQHAVKKVFEATGYRLEQKA